MNVYDFDKTIYRRDSSVDFYFYSLIKKPSIIFDFPLLRGIKYILGLEDKEVWKESLFSFVKNFKDIDRHIEDFWDKHIGGIKSFYYENQKKDDLVISASPEFLIKPICYRIGIKNVLASPIDKESGEYYGRNCWGEEKLRRFKESFPNGKINEFYSDSYSDTPLARLAEKAFIVKGEDFIPWERWDEDLGKI